MLDEYSCPNCKEPVFIRNIGSHLEVVCPKCKFAHRLNLTFPSEPAIIHNAWKEDRKKFIKE